MKNHGRKFPPRPADRRSSWRSLRRARDCRRLPRCRGSAAAPPAGSVHFRLARAHGPRPAGLRPGSRGRTAARGPARAAACVRLGCRAAFDSFSVRNSAAVEYSSAVVMRLWCAAAAPLPARTRRANKSDGKMSAGRAETLKCGLTRAALTRPRPTASRAYVSEPRHASIRTPVTPYSNQRHKRRLPLADGWPVRTTSGCQACLTSSISLCRSSIASATAIATNAKSSFCATDEPAAVST